MQIVLSMKKIRINELARELEVKAHEILDRLPELGVTEKKTHPSSIDEDVAIKLRRLYGFDTPGEAEAAGEPAQESAAQTETMETAEHAASCGASLSSAASAVRSAAYQSSL